MDITALSAKTPAARPQDSAMMKTAREFEGMFLSQMLSHMFSGVETDSMFGGGHGEDMFRGMIVDEYGKMMARTGGIGMADDIQKAMLRMQEAGNGGRKS